MTASDVLIDPSNLPWIPIADGIDYRILRTSKETGVWTVLFRAQPGAVFAPHRHLGAGEYYVIKGRMQYRAVKRKPVIMDMNRLIQFTRK